MKLSSLLFLCPSIVLATLNSLVFLLLSRAKLACSECGQYFALIASTESLSNLVRSTWLYGVLHYVSNLAPSEEFHLLPALVVIFHHRMMIRKQKCVLYCERESESRELTVSNTPPIELDFLLGPTDNIQVCWIVQRPNRYRNFNPNDEAAIESLFKCSNLWSLSHLLVHVSDCGS